MSSKVQYDATIVANHNPKILVKYQSRRKPMECDVSQIERMNGLRKRKISFPEYFAMQSPGQKSMKVRDDDGE